MERKNASNLNFYFIYFLYLISLKKQNTSTFTKLEFFAFFFIFLKTQTKKNENTKMNFPTAFFGVLLLASLALGQQCQSPKFSEVKTYTTQDAKLTTETTYTVQFRVKCANNGKNVPFFTINPANGHFIVSSSDVSGEVYQVGP